jgi:hypothetical protein
MTQFSQSAIGQSILGAIAELTGESSELRTEIDAMPLATLYTDVSITSLTSAQAAGTDPILPQDVARKALKIQPSSNCILSITSGSSVGITLVAGFPNDFSAGECPANALYVKGLAAGTALTIWKA